MDINLLVHRFCGYSNYIRGFSKSTIQRYRKVLGLFISDTRVGQVDDITIDQVRTWFFNGRTVREWNASTFHTYHKSLKVFFRWCVREGYLQANPVADI